MIKEVLVFGYNEYAKEISSNFVLDSFNVSLYVLDENSYNSAKEDGYQVELVELDDDWLDIQENFDIQKVICFCALDDDAQNVFLTISLRAQYPELRIVSLATSKDSADKLHLAGANKAIPKLETTANDIVESLEKPAVIEVMNDILYRNKDLKLAEYTVFKDSVYDMRLLSEVGLHKEHNIIILAIADNTLESKFTFTSGGEHQRVKEGDVLVVMGKENDLIAFERVIK